MEHFLLSLLFALAPRISIDPPEPDVASTKEEEEEEALPKIKLLFSDNGEVRLSFTYATSA